jgi:hypothetical protein
MKIQNPNLRPEETDRALDYDAALAHFFKVRGLSRDSQEAFTITVGNCVSRFAGVREAFALLDREQDTNVPRYLSEAPVNVQARVILLNLPTVPHEGELRRAAVVLRVAAVWYEVMKALKASTISDGFAARLKQTLGATPMSYLSDGDTCLNTIGDLLGWYEAWMAPSGAVIPGGDMSGKVAKNYEDVQKIREGEEAIREAARRVVEGELSERETAALNRLKALQENVRSMS